MAGSEGGVDRALGIGALGRFGIPLILVALLTAFSLLLPESFATVSNFRAIANNQTIVVLLALATALPLIVGQFDLSVAAVLTASQNVAVGLAAKQGVEPGLAIALALLVGAFIGLVNGVVVAKLQVNAFVATLGSSTVVGGLVLWYTEGETTFENVPGSLTSIGRDSLLGLPLPIIYTAAIAAVLWVILGRTPVGRRMYATGGNRRAAALSGIGVGRYVIGAFVASGVLSAVAGVILGARLGAASPAAGNSLLLPAFAGAFLGATTIQPGRFNVLGTVVSVYVLSVTISGLQQLGAPAWVEPTFNGTVLIVAVALSTLAVRLRARSARRRQLALLEADSTPRRDEPAQTISTVGSSP